MKAKTMVAATTLLMSSGLALAAGDANDHKGHHPESAAGGTAQQSPAGPGSGMPMMKMHEKMQSQMAEIRRTEDPVRRDELIQSHMDEMQGMMKMMQGMQSGKSMMGKGDMMEMMNRQNMTEQRMENMQMMLDQLMQNQAATEETRKIRERRHDHRKTMK